MEEAKNFMNLEIMAKVENIALSRLSVASFASQLDFTLAEIEEIKVAISETVSNAIIHGYGDEKGIVRITVNIYPEKMIITVLDEGKGMADVALAKEPSYTTDPERMGLGLAFVDSFMDELKIISTPNQGTKVVMTKYLESNYGN